MTSKFLHGLHDPGGEHLMADKPGWIVHTVAVSQISRQDFTQWQDRGFTNLVRLNWGYEPEGTIPHRARWDQFCALCANFVRNSPGADHFIIGNEPNHRVEWPYGEVIQPEVYADLFNRVYIACKIARDQAEIGTAAVAPWNIEAGMDWLRYLNLMLSAVRQTDFVALHGYTHGSAPSLIYSQTKVNNWYWHWPVVYQQIQAIPSKFARKPVDITEADQDGAWLDANTGWVKLAYGSVHAYNQTPGTQKIRSLSLYRWQKHQGQELWSIEDRPGVQRDFAEAAAQGYPNPYANGDGPVKTPPVTTIVLPDIKKGEKPVNPTAPVALTDFDPRARARGVEIVYPDVLPGIEVWYPSKIQWLDEQESQGRHHIYGNVYGEAGQVLYNKQIGIEDYNRVQEFVITKADNASPYSYNYPMWPQNIYEVWVNDDCPSAQVKNITTGQDGNKNVHTSTVVEWRLGVIEPKVTTPDSGNGTIDDPGPNYSFGDATLILPVQGRISQRWGQNPENYARFGIPYHNGLDIAAPEGSPVVAMADGVVMWADHDKDYGHYVRIYHPQFGFHSFVAHLLDYQVEQGQHVKQGQPIGRCGSTGNSTGPHVHLEIRLGTENGYAQGTFGHGSGRIDPEIALYFFRKA